MAEVFEVEDSDFGGGMGITEVCSSNEMGAPNASHLEQKTTQPNRPKQTKISPGKRPCVDQSDQFPACRLFGIYRRLAKNRRHCYGIISLIDLRSANSTRN